MSGRRRPTPVIPMTPFAYRFINRVRQEARIKTEPVALASGGHVRHFVAYDWGTDTFILERDIWRLKLAAERAGASISEEVSFRPGGRVRALGAVPEELYEQAAEVGAVILDGPVLADGRRELLPFLLEQALTVTLHRFGVLRKVGSIRQ